MLCSCCMGTSVGLLQLGGGGSGSGSSDGLAPDNVDNVPKLLEEDEDADRVGREADPARHPALEQESGTLLPHRLGQDVHRSERVGRVHDARLDHVRRRADCRRNRATEEGGEGVQWQTVRHAVAQQHRLERVVGHELGRVHEHATDLGSAKRTMTTSLCEEEERE